MATGDVYTIHARTRRMGRRPTQYNKIIGWCSRKDRSDGRAYNPMTSSSALLFVLLLQRLLLFLRFVCTFPSSSLHVYMHLEPPRTHSKLIDSSIWAFVELRQRNPLSEFWLQLLIQTRRKLHCIATPQTRKPAHEATSHTAKPTNHSLSSIDPRDASSTNCQPIRAKEIQPTASQFAPKRFSPATSSRKGMHALTGASKRKYTIS